MGVFKGEGRLGDDTIGVERGSQVSILFVDVGGVIPVSLVNGNSFSMKTTCLEVYTLEVLGSYA